MGVRFDAANEEFTRSAAGLGGFDITIASWVCIDVDRNDYSFFYSLQGGANTIAFGTGSDGTTTRVITNSHETACPAFTVGTWYYTALVYTVTTGANNTAYTGAYTAATLTATTAAGNDVVDDSQTFYLATTGSLNGRLHNVKVWAAALTAAELEQERWSHLPQRTSNLWAWYPLDGNNEVDYSGNGRTLTAAGTPTTAHGPSVSYGAPVLPTHLAAAAAAVNSGFLALMGAA